MRASIKILALSLIGLLTACEPAPLGGGRFSVEGPGRLTRALEPDQALCSKLDVELTFDRTDDMAPPPIDGVDLIPQDGDVCTWVLEAEYQLPAGTYDLQVDFDALDGAADCEILAGMYIRRDLEFPFDDSVQPLTDDDFLSTPEDEDDPRLQGQVVDFDYDDDGLDNLQELASDANPCKVSSIPQVDLTVDAGPIEEGTPFDIVVSTSDEDGASHRAVVTISHHNGDGHGPETVTFTHYSHTEQDFAIEPDPAGLPWDQEWNLAAGPDELSDTGAGRWTLSFTPQEPFVGSLTIRAQVDNGAGNLFDQSDPVQIEITEIADPPFIVLEGEGTPFQGVLEFEEQAADPTQHRITIMNLDLGSPASLLTTELADCTPPPDQSWACPEGLHLARDGSVTVLSWSPQNHHVLGPPLIATLELTDTEGITQSEVQVPMVVNPLFNDPPEIIPPAAQDLALPKTGFDLHQADFVVVDIDQVIIPPVCSVTGFDPAPGTSCDNALKEVSCEIVQGSQDGAYWDAVLTLIPDTGYAGCGNKPAFDVSFRVDDSPPANAVNDTEADTYSARFRTPDIVSIVPLGIAGLDFAGAIYLDGSIKRALVSMHEDLPNRMVFAILGLDTTPQSENFGLLRTFDHSEANASGFGTFVMYQTGVVDEVNHRVALIDNFLPGAEDGLIIFDLVSLEIGGAWDLGTACNSGVQTVGGLGDMTNPVVDPVTGHIYFLCDTDSGIRVVRVDQNYNRTHILLGDINAMSTQKDFSAVVVDPTGTSWLVLNAVDSFYLVDLTTFEDATPLTMILSHPQADALVERMVDDERGSLLFAYQANGYQTYLGRILFESGAPSIDTPLLMSADFDPSNRPITLRRPFSGAGTPPPQLVYSLEFDYNDPPEMVYVDLGEPGEQRPWAEMRRQNSFDLYRNGFSMNFHPSADRRYFLQPIVGYDPTGFHLHAFQENVESVIYDSVEDPDHQLPKISNVQVVATSRQANLSLVSANYDATSDFVILDFIEAASQMDQ